jgi:hypothetical protein
LSSKQKADAKTDKATGVVEDKTLQVFHAAHVEFFKGGLALSGTPDFELVSRFSRNGLGLMAQVDPLTAAETTELFAIVADLRSGDAKRVANAEAKQRAVEGENVELSRSLAAAKSDLSKAIEAGKAKDASLAAAFLRENELADTLRNQQFIMWAAIGGVVILSALSLYLRMGLGSVGAGLSFLPKIIGADASKKVIDTLDAETDWLHQKIVGYGHAKAAQLKAKAERILSA